MIGIAGRCIIEHQIGWLAGAGVTGVVVSAGHLHEVLIEDLLVGSQPVRVDTVNAQSQAGAEDVDVMQFGQVPNPLSAERRYWHGASLTAEQIRGAGYQGAARGPTRTRSAGCGTRPPSHTDQQMVQAVRP